MKKTLIAVFTIFVMVVAACGGSDSGSDNESSQSSANESTTSPEGNSQEDSSPVSEDTDGNNARDTLIGLVSAVTGLDNEGYVACIIDSVAEAEGLTYEEILQDLTSEGGQTDQAAEAASIACIANCLQKKSWNFLKLMEREKSPTNLLKQTILCLPFESG